ncbi:glycerophosphodiester phosphodiesterase family protein [Rhodococcus sp. Leaf278]|uniref:glycerophosphodiester phosphodiesterase family protein n=1 Tax=Rhodococcus sp. Leaf278 TaxID=1736319 RepID=UPI0009E71702|nr:glycerophosphodiester phosphodiesterase family protein [Rhodococcus sp. Leaf278]
MRFVRYIAVACVSALALTGCGTESTTDPALPESGAAPLGSFDLQAHRGGLGLVTESTIESFSNALQLGVSTLELDTQITEDGVAIVTHDRKVSDKKCIDTGASTPGDPDFPYVGKFVDTLTLAQIRTLDCGALPLADYPEQRRVPGARMPTLTEVLDLVKSVDAPDVKLNVETKVEAGSPTETAPREQFVDTVLGTIEEAGMLDRITVQSFDWGALKLVRDDEPEVPVVALTNGDFLQVGQDGVSPWLGGLDIDDFGGDAIAAIDSFGASAYSPVQGKPQSGKVGDPDFDLFVTQAMVDAAHERGIRVIPWTVDDPDTMRALMDLGVDGLITDYPDRVRTVMSERGLPLPEPAR